MDSTLPALFLAAAALGASFALLGLANGRARSGRDRASRATRALNLAAQELRGLATTLNGYGDPGLARRSDLASVARRLLSLSDDLQADPAAHPSPRSFSPESVDLGEAARGAVDCAAALLTPGLRSWSVDPALEGMRLWADSRALREVLGRVLAEAVQNTRHADRIRMLPAARPGAAGVTIEDEGAGTASPAPGPVRQSGTADTRGLDTHLVLARTLMRAQGGVFLLEAAPNVGTRVTLLWPQPGAA